METGSMRKAFFYLEAFLMGKKNAGIAFVRAVLRGQCCEYTIGPRARAMLHTLTFSEGAIFKGTSSAISGGTLERGRFVQYQSS